MDEVTGFDAVGALDYARLDKHMKPGHSLYFRRDFNDNIVARCAVCNKNVYVWKNPSITEKENESA